MGKTIWRELTIASLIWLLSLYVLNVWWHGFVDLVLPLQLLAAVWCLNTAGYALLTRR